MGVWKRVARGGTAAAAVATAALAVGLGAGLGFGRGAQAQATDDVPPGRAVYEQYCAACHDKPPPGDRAAPVSAIRQMSAQTLTTVLTTGVMKPIGDQLDRNQMRALVAYLAAPEGPAGTGWLDDNKCPAERAAVNLTAKPAQVGFGVDQDNTRRQTAAQAGLKTADLANLEVAWTFAMPKTTGLRGNGVVVGDTVFYPAGQAGYVVALDTQTGCLKWATELPSGLRNSLAYGQLGKGGPMGLVGGDSAGMLVALEAKTGKIVWRVDPKHDPASPLSGSPLFAGDKIIVPVSAMDVAAAMRPTHECCKSHGDIVAVDAATGKTLWTWHTMEPAKALGRKNSAGVEMYGPSGAPIWSSPAYDAERNVIYTATGENTSPPATKTSDAVIAIDADTGKEKWVFQALANDVWNMSCPIGPPPPGQPLKPNCFFANEGSVLLDHDFGGGPLIFRGKGGKDVILAGQKSGELWALDPKTGRKLWRHQFGFGHALGGVHWGITTDGKHVFAPISDPGVPADRSAAGMHAVDVASGKIAWQWRASPDCSGDRQARMPICGQKYGLSAAPLVIDGALLAGSLDGRLWVFEAATGKVLASYDTARPFQAVNGIAGSGGSIDAAGLFAGDGMVFVNSGYASFGQQPGNALVAYRPKAR